jgi:hypothetical protein
VALALPSVAKEKTPAEPSSLISVLDQVPAGGNLCLQPGFSPGLLKYTSCFADLSLLRNVFFIEI